MDAYLLISYLVFVSQILLVSFYSPIKNVSNLNRFIHDHPESEYPHLHQYPKEDFDRVMHFSKALKIIIGVIALAILWISLLKSFPMTLILQSMAVVLIAQVAVSMYFSKWMMRNFIPAIKSMKGPSIRKAQLQARSLERFVPPIFGVITGLFVLSALYSGVFSVFQIDSNVWKLLILFFTSLTALASWRGLVGARRLLMDARVDPFEAGVDIEKRTRLFVRVLMVRSCFLSAATLFVCSAGLGLLENINPWLLVLFFSTFFQLISLLSTRSMQRAIIEADYSGYHKDVILADG